MRKNKTYTIEMHAFNKVGKCSRDQDCRSVLVYKWKKLSLRRKRN